MPVKNIGSRMTLYFSTAVAEQNIEEKTTTAYQMKTKLKYQVCIARYGFARGCIECRNRCQFLKCIQARKIAISFLTRWTAKHDWVDWWLLVYFEQSHVGVERRFPHYIKSVWFLVWFSLFFQNYTFKSVFLSLYFQNHTSRSASWEVGVRRSNVSTSACL